MLVIFLLSSLFLFSGGNSKDLCPISYQNLYFGENKSFENLGKDYLSFCSDFSQNTCCSKEQTRKYLRDLQEFIGENINSACSAFVEKALCFGCQSRLSLKSCLGFCTQLLESCKGNYFDFSSSKLKGCTQDSIVCSQLEEVSGYNSPKDICRYFGLEIEADEEEECYYGIDSTISLIKSIKKSRTEDDTFVNTEDIRLVIIALLGLGMLGLFIFFF